MEVVQFIPQELVFSHRFVDVPSSQLQEAAVEGDQGMAPNLQNVCRDGLVLGTLATCGAWNVMQAMSGGGNTSWIVAVWRWVSVAAH